MPRPARAARRAPWSTTRRSRRQGGRRHPRRLRRRARRAARASPATARTWIARYQAAARSRRTGIASLKVGFNKVFGYYIEVTHTPTPSKVPPDYIRKQTLKNAERYITPELKEYEEKVLTAEEKSHAAASTSCSSTLRDRVAAQTRPAAADGRGAGARSTCWRRWPSWPRRGSYCRPELVDEPVLDDRGRPASGARPDAAAGDVRAQRRRRSGPSDGHASGSSPARTWRARARTSARSRCSRCWRRSAASCRRKRRSVGVADRIFTRVGASDELSRGPEHVHGRDDRDGEHPQQRHAAQPGHPRRDRPRHQHLRRRLAGLGDRRAPARRASAAARCSPRTTTSWPSWPRRCRACATTTCWCASGRTRSSSCTRSPRQR